MTAKRINMKIRRSGFTLIELLVVVAVLAILMAFAGYGVMRARDFARSSADQQLLRAIGDGLDSYQREIGSLPASYDSNALGTGENWFGCHMLAQAMLGKATEDDTATGNLTPIDGYEGAGFRLKPRGKVYGPYLEPGTQTKLLDTDSGQQRLVIIDSSDNPVLYYLARTDTAGTLLNDPRFDAKHNPNGPGGSNPPDDAVDTYVMHGSSVPLEDRNDIPRYLLATPGPDEQWYQTGDKRSEDVNNLDWSK